MTELTELHKTVVTTPSDTEIRTERIFDAPPEVIFEFWTDPDLLAQWVGPERLAMTVEEYDVRPGGKYRYVHRDGEGNEYVFFGEFLENAQGEDDVAGIRTPHPLPEMEALLPEAYAQFISTMERLEQHYRDMQDVEFTIEEGQLYILQTRSAKRTAC